MSDSHRDDTLTAIKALQRELAVKSLTARGKAAQADNVATRERLIGQAEAWEQAVRTCEFHYTSQAARPVRSLKPSARA